MLTLKRGAMANEKRLYTGMGGALFAVVLIFAVMMLSASGYLAYHGEWNGNTLGGLRGSCLKDARILPERPAPDGTERSLSSPQYDAIQVMSLNPPDMESTSGLDQLELASRLVIGIAVAVHSGGHRNNNISDLHIMKTTFMSFVPTARPAYVYRFYLAFDTVDPVFNQTTIRDALAAQLKELVAAEDGKRWHPEGYHTGAVDPSALLVSLHWVACSYTAKPAWAQNDAALAAFKEGADYVLRTNDDTKLPSQQGWETLLIQDLRRRRPIPNLGVVGPLFTTGNTGILTHDFTHRTHAVIHGLYYPRSMPTWYADDWITQVYSGYTSPPLMVKRKDVQVEHTLAPQRYDAAVPANISAILAQEVAKGQKAIRDFALQNFNITPTRRRH